jgi:hypothetical protein
MNEPQDREAVSDALKEELTQPVIFSTREKHFVQRIVNLVRSESGSSSPTVLAQEKEKGKAETDQQEKAKWNKEFDRLNRSLEFHTDFALKTVAFFYGAVGGVLSIFLGKGGGSRSASIVLLGVPIIMSWILGYYFFYGALIWDKDADYMRRLAARLGFEELTKIELLSEILRVFGGLFFVTGAFLIALLIWVLKLG